MDIVPTINCGDFQCVLKRLEIAGELGVGWVQIDIADGVFGKPKNWNNPEEIDKGVDLKNLSFYTEVHLMEEKPMGSAAAWLDVGVDRIIVHAGTEFDFGDLLEMCRKYDAELGMAVTIEDSLNEVMPLLEKSDMIQVLGVMPGPSGQDFNGDVILFINDLLSRLPDATIEVDGGVDDKVAGRLKDVGVNQIAVGSFIFNSPNPMKRYKMLKQAIS